MAGSGSEGHVAVAGGRVWYGVAGDGPGVPLLALHGGPGFPHDYLSPLAALGDDRPVVFYDQLGCGQSDRPADPGLWTLERFVAELGQVRRALGLTRVHLFGHSWGTSLAVDYALTRPGGLVSLVLASPTLSIPRWLADLAAYRRSLPPAVREALDRHEAAGTLDSPEYQAATAQFYRHHLCRLYPWPEPLLRSIAGASAAVYETLWGPNEFVITGRLRGYDCTARLGEIAAPTLLTCGRFDEATPATTAHYQSLIPGAALAVFEQSAHVPHLEEAALYRRVLRGFLAGAEANQPA